MSTMKQTRRKAPASKKSVSRPAAEAWSSAGNGETRITENERRRMVAEAAYYRALSRGFAAGGEVDDWLAAEREIDLLFGAAGSRSPALQPTNASVARPAGESRRPGLTQ